MFTKTVSVVLAAAALVSAQSSLSLPAGSPSIDACTQQCLTQAASQNGCSITDVSCVCTNTQFQTAAASCLQQSCPASDVATALALQSAICANASGSSSATSAASTASSSATSASSAASSAGSSLSSAASSALSSASSAASSAGSSLSSAASSAASSLSSALSSATSAAASSASSAATSSGSSSAGSALAVNVQGLVGLGVALVGVAAGAGLVL